jgi:hypothetical protein
MHTKIHLLAFLSAGTILGLTGCFLDSTPEPEPLPLADAFAVRAELSFEYGGPGSELPESQGFVLRLDDADADVAAIFTSSEGTSSGAFARAGAGISLRAPVELAIVPRPGTEDARLILEDIHLTVLDRDGDGSADAVEGAGSGAYSFFVGTTEFSESFTADLSGELDE